jgi:hypothetical protein
MAAFLNLVILNLLDVAARRGLQGEVSWSACHSHIASACLNLP